MIFLFLINIKKINFLNYGMKNFLLNTYIKNLSRNKYLVNYKFTTNSYTDL